MLAAVAYVNEHGPTQLLPVAVAGAQQFQKAVTRADVAARAVADGFAKPNEKRNTRNQRLSRALRKLVRKERVRQEGVHLALAGPPGR